MNNLILSKETLLYQNKEWPFTDYQSEINNLSQYFDKQVELHTLASNGVNRKKIVPMGFFEINQKYLNPENKNSLYPHSLVFNDGSAINMNQVMFINLESKTEEFWSQLDPFMFAIKPNKENLKLFNSPNMLYKNIHFFKKCVYSSKSSQNDIFNMTQKAYDMGMFD